MTKVEKLVPAAIFAVALGCGSSTNSAGGGNGGGRGGSTTNATGGGAGSSTTSATGGAGGSATAATGGAGGSATAATGGAGGSATAATGGAGGSAASACILPSCLQTFAKTCVFGGACTTQQNSDTGDNNVCYANGVKAIPVTDILGDNSTAMTVTNGSSPCFSTAYNGNDVMSGAGGIITVKDASGTVVASVTMDSSGAFFIATCPQGQPVSLDPSCSNAWPISGLMAPSSDSCTQGVCTP